MMNLILLTTIFIMSSVFGCAQQADKIKVPEQVIKYHGSMIKDALDLNRWTIEIKPSSIYIRSKFEVDFQNKVGVSVGQKPISTNYSIRLDFKNELGKEAYIELANRRAKFAATLNYGSKTKGEWVEAARFLKKNPLPRYGVVDSGGRGHSVYRNTYDSISLVLVSPQKIFLEVRSTEAIIDSLFIKKAH